MASCPSIVVFTDVGVKDIDDEILLQYLIENKKDLELHIIFMGSDGVSPEKALWEWSNYKKHILSKYTVEEQVELCKNISYHTIENFKNIKCSFDYALQISPMNGYNGENIDVKGKYVFAGDYITPEGVRPSFNRVGAEEILDRFHEEGKLVDISSAHMAKMRFNKELVGKFTGPFRDSIVFTAFMLAFGRMDPNHPAKKFAEGLVNPDVGRGANYNSVMKMKEVLDIHPDNEDESSVAAATKYFRDLEGNGINSGTHEESIKSLTEMNMILQGISDKSCLESGMEKVNIFQSGEVYTSNFTVDSIPELLKPSWELFKANADKLYESFNPVYDLFAGYVLIGLIDDECRKVDTVEEFLKNVCSEF